MFPLKQKWKPGQQADTEGAAKKSFLGRVKSLTDHTALMLLFYFKSTPNKFTAGYLNNLLYGSNSFIESKVSDKTTNSPSCQTGYIF